MIAKYIRNIILFTILGGLVGLLTEFIINVEATLMFIGDLLLRHPVVVIGMVIGFSFGVLLILNSIDAKTIYTLRGKRGKEIHTIKKDDKFWMGEAE